MPYSSRVVRGVILALGLGLATCGIYRARTEPVETIPAARVS